MRHVKLAIRTLSRTPFVTAVAVLSLALGIGANTAIFSLADQLLLEQLPVPDPGRLVDLAAPGPKGGSEACGIAGTCEEIFSYPMYRDLERGQRVLTGLAAHVPFDASLAAGGQPFIGQALLVSGSYFPTLGLRPALGRLLGRDDDVNVGAEDVAVLSWALWHGRMGADSAVLGRTIVVNGHALAIVGVAPPGFDGTTVGAHPVVFVPLAMSGVLAGFNGYTDRSDYWLYLFGRLKPGVSLAEARSALDGIYHPIVADVEAPLQQGMSAADLERFRAKRLAATPGFRGQSQMHQRGKAPLVMLFGVTGVVLLIACANIANLLLARGAGRAREMGVRLALGARRRQLVGQLLTESVVLASLGGVASLVVADLTLRLLTSLLPGEAAGVLPSSLALSPAVLAFDAALAIGTGLLMGLYPALHGTRLGLVEAIRAGGSQHSAHRGAARFRAVLVTAQITLASALLICAGLFLKSLVNVARVDLGLRVDDLVTFTISPGRSGYDSTRAALLYRQVQDELARLPGVTAVTTSKVPLLAGSYFGKGAWVQGVQGGSGDDHQTMFNAVGPGYFRTLGIPVLAGREFTSADAQGAPRVAIVNEAFARKFHLGGDVLHRYMSDRGPDSMNIEIVGLVRDAKYRDVKEPAQPLFVTPWMQAGEEDNLSFYVRTTVPPEQQVRAIPVLLARLAPTVPLDHIATMPQQVRDNSSGDRVITIVSAVFAALATLLAAVGLYGVLAYTVQQRTNEIGIRMALGADGADVRALVVRQMGTMGAIGGALGLAAALALGRVLQSLLYGMRGDDPVVFASSLVLLAGVAFAAAYLPARRASRVDPIQAPRYE